MTINVNVNALFGQYGKRLDVVVKKISTDLLRLIVQKTPVDTGRARGAWTVGINEEPSEETPLDKTKDGAATAARGEERILRSSPGDTITIINRLPYIQALEDGHSKQSAPGNMVHGSVMQIKNQWGKL